MRKIMLFCLSLLLVAQVVTAQDETINRDWSAINDYIIQIQRARPDRLGDTAYDGCISSWCGNDIK